MSNYRILFDTWQLLLVDKGTRRSYEVTVELPDTAEFQSYGRPVYKTMFAAHTLGKYVSFFFLFSFFFLSFFFFLLLLSSLSPLLPPSSLPLLPLPRPIRPSFKATGGQSTKRCSLLTLWGSMFLFSFFFLSFFFFLLFLSS